MGRFSKRLPAFDIIPPVGCGAHRKGLAGQAAVLCHSREKLLLFHTAEEKPDATRFRRRRFKLAFAVNIIDVKDPERLSAPVEKIYGFT